MHATQSNQSERKTLSPTDIITMPTMTACSKGSRTRNSNRTGQLKGRSHLSSPIDHHRSTLYVKIITRSRRPSLHLCYCFCCLAGFLLIISVSTIRCRDRYVAGDVCAVQSKTLEIRCSVTSVRERGISDYFIEHSIDDAL